MSLSENRKRLEPDAASPIGGDAKKKLARRRTLSENDLREVNSPSSQNSRPPAFKAKRKEQSRSPASPHASLVVSNLPARLCSYVSFCKFFAESMPTEARQVTAIRAHANSESELLESVTIRGPRSLLTDISEKLSSTEKFKEVTTVLESPKPVKQKGDVRWVTLKGITISASSHEILEDLKAQIGPNIQYVQRLHHLKEGKPDFSSPLPIVRVRYTGVEAETALLSKDFRLFGVLPLHCSKPRIEPEVPHSSKCLRWGHGANSCRKPRRCSHCGGANHTKFKFPNFNAPSRCANCLEEHYSWYKGCKFFAEAKAELIAKARISAS